MTDSLVMQKRKGLRMFQPLLSMSVMVIDLETLNEHVE